eukprot:EC721480.1.p1 GENE.EC721480.1~~EC721480.1.p1  ORF type:complete len:143 (+),score=10.23 EC721480.1:87-515(+)
MGLLDLTDDALSCVLDKLSLTDLSRVMRVCRYFNNLVDEPTRWRKLILLEAPLTEGVDDITDPKEYLRELRSFRIDPEHMHDRLTLDSSGRAVSCTTEGRLGFQATRPVPLEGITFFEVQADDGPVGEIGMAIGVVNHSFTL